LTCREKKKFSLTAGLTDQPSVCFIDPSVPLVKISPFMHCKYGTETTLHAKPDLWRTEIHEKYTNKYFLNLTKTILNL
jgi:hypothetical protein